MMNDANLAALGEATFGAGRGMRTVMHVSVVQGIGAGLVVDGRLFTGAHGFSGELAHVQVTPDGPPCVCGNRGCLAIAAGPEYNKSGAAPERHSVLGSLTGQALAPFITAFDPDCVVTDARLGGDAASFTAALTAELAQRCPPSLTDGLAILPGTLDDAELHGALAAADAYALPSQS
jgi:predicted NBD/HSP70 family sugar kinase